MEGFYMKLLHLITAIFLGASLAGQMLADEAIQRDMWFQTTSEKEVTHTKISVNIPTSIKNLPVEKQRETILLAIRKATLEAIAGLEIRENAILMGSPEVPTNKDGSIATDLARQGAFIGITKKVNYNWFETLDWKRFMWM